MKKLVMVLLMFLATSVVSNAAGPWRVGIGLDLFKTDFDQIADKTQIGLEVNYFLIRNFALTGGYEMWSQGGNSLVLGARFYPINPIYLRFRGLIKDNSDLSLGAGYVRSLSRNWKIDMGGDYFFNDGELAIRLGFAYLF